MADKKKDKQYNIPVVSKLCCSKCKEPMTRSVAQWVCINQLCSGEVKHDY